MGGRADSDGAVLTRRLDSFEPSSKRTAAGPFAAIFTRYSVVTSLRRRVSSSEFPRLLFSLAYFSSSSDRASTPPSPTSQSNLHLNPLHIIPRLI